MENKNFEMYIHTFVSIEDDIYFGFVSKHKDYEYLFREKNMNKTFIKHHKSYEMKNEDLDAILCALANSEKFTFCSGSGRNIEVSI